MSYLFCILVMLSQRSTLLTVLLTLLLIALVTWTVAQTRERRQLLRELEAMGGVTQRDIEFDMVLKAMRLCTWRLDVVSRSLNVESDYTTGGETDSTFASVSLEKVIEEAATWDKERLAKALDDFCTGKSDEYHIVYARSLPPLGKPFWVESFASVAERNPDGSPKTIVGTTMAINKQKQLEKELTEARDKAEESDRLKTEFLNNMSHEIRTPLNAIVGFSSLLGGVGEDERTQLTALIKENADMLLRIFDDMVKMSKLEATTAERVRIENFSVNQMVRDIVDEYSRKNRKPNLRIYKRKLPVEIYIGTDRSKLALIVEHFVSNAVKFTNEGDVEVICEQHSPMHVKISVRDTGKGISPESQKRIFERFVKVDRFTQGTGLGLSVCRAYAQSLGGRLGVESEVGKGSVFWVEI